MNKTMNINEHMRFEMIDGKPYVVSFGYENLPDQKMKIFKADSETPYIKTVGMILKIIGDEKVLFDKFMAM